MRLFKLQLLNLITVLYYVKDEETIFTLMHYNTSFFFVIPIKFIFL